MPKTTRRKFLKQTGASVAGMAALDWGAVAMAGSTTSSPMIWHRALDVQGVHAYADRESVAAGQTIAFRVSSTERYQLSICRLGLRVDDPASDSVLHEFPKSQSKLQR